MEQIPWHLAHMCALPALPGNLRIQEAGTRQGWSGSGLRHSYLVDQKEEPGESLLGCLDEGGPMLHS